MAADNQGTLKCRIVLEARWEDDGTVDGNLSWDHWVVNTLEETYGEENRTRLPGAERARIQVVYVPASRDGARQLTAFLRGRLWRAAQWSDELRELVAASAAQVSDKFHDEAATSTVEKALVAAVAGAARRGNALRPPVSADRAGRRPAAARYRAEVRARPRRGGPSGAAAQ